jgi:hypothetical protein
MLLSLGIRYFADPVRLAQNSSNPANDLHEMIQRDPTLGSALDKADQQGDIIDLTTWINRADPILRQRLAWLLLGLVEKRIGPGLGKPDQELCWKYRNRFRAFLNLSTGLDFLDTVIDNMVAYTLVTATPSPSEADIALAKSLLPRLRHDAQENGDDSLMDTVGCVQFIALDFVGAKDSFTKALQFARDAHDPKRHGNDALYQKRLDAAEKNIVLKAANPDPTAHLTYVPLPAEDEPAPEAVDKAEKKA